MGPQRPEVTVLQAVSNATAKASWTFCESRYLREGTVILVTTTAVCKGGTFSFVHPAPVDYLPLNCHEADGAPLREGVAVPHKSNKFARTVQSVTWLSLIL